MISSFWEAAAVLLAGVWAGTINTVVGSGTLVSFPILVAVGVPPVTANVSNSIGLVPGSVTGAWGYRKELRGQGRRLRWLIPATVLGGALGAVLLLWLPASTFEAVVPALIGLGVVLVLLGPRISRAVLAHHAQRGGVPERGVWWVWPAVFGTGVYGGYFGAAQGVLLMAVLGTGVDESLQRLNGIKNILAAVVNAIAGLIFAIVADVDWWIVLLIGIGSVIGGQIGATVGRRLPPVGLRIAIVAVGTVALVVFLLS
jgi:uncharacterized membrane protein YfcA